MKYRKHQSRRCCDEEIRIDGVVPGFLRLQWLEWLPDWGGLDEVTG